MAKNSGNTGINTCISQLCGSSDLSSPFKIERIPHHFKSRLFQVEQIKLADRYESIVKGGRHLYSKLPEAFKGIKKIAVVGYGPQGGAQAQNLKDSLRGTGIETVVGLRNGSSSRLEARNHGFTEQNGGLKDTSTAIAGADLVLGLIADGAMAHSHEKLIFNHMKPGATLGLSHGFLLSHLNSIGKSFPDSLNVIAVCPKGVGASVRRLYEQGKSVNGAGINSSFAVHQAVDIQRSTDLALGWSVALGSPFTFQTTLESEYKSDIFGERGVLVGGIHGITECLSRWLRLEHNVSAEEAYIRTVSCITGPISRIISSRGGLLGVVRQIRLQGQEDIFAKAFVAAYQPSLDLLTEIYDSVASGDEVKGVVQHGRRLSSFPMKSMAKTPLWKTGAAMKLRATTPLPQNVEIDPVTAGIYLSVMVAQCDILDINGHCYSEIANESIIEAVDSLNPYMAFKGVDYLVDNCSTTARLGSRKWAPRFDYILTQQALPYMESVVDDVSSSPLYEAFLNHKIHDILRECSKLRPSVDILPVETFLEHGAKTVSS